MTPTYDLHSAEFFADPYPTCARMREGDPVYFDPIYNMWFVSRYQDIVSYVRDRRFSNARVEPFFDGVCASLSDKVEVLRDFLSAWMVFLDPQAHTAIRKLTAHAFLPKTIAQTGGLVQGIVDEVLEQLPSAGGGFDLVRDFSLLVPARVISHMLGVRRADVPVFESWVRDLFRIPGMVGDRDENIRLGYQAVMSMSDYFRELIAQRRARPVDDLLGIMVRAEEDGQVLDERQLVAGCALLLLAGHETTTYLISNAFIALARNPDQLELLRARPELMDVAVEEFLRYDGPAGGLARLATQQVRIGGQVIAAGQVVIGLPWSANRDPGAFAEPDRLMIDRRDNRHLGFGTGPHVCLGASLARLETKLALTSLLARYPEIALADGPLEWIQSLAIRGVTSLPVTV
jgi:cytochrome P450